MRSDNTSRVQESEGINCCTYHLCLQKQLRTQERMFAACHVRGTRTRVHTNKGAQAVKLLCTRIRVRTNKCAQAVGLLCTRRVHEDKGHCNRTSVHKDTPHKNKGAQEQGCTEISFEAARHTCTPTHSATSSVCCGLWTLQLGFKLELLSLGMIYRYSFSAL